MSEQHMTIEEINQLRREVQEARKGIGEFPSRERLKAAFNSIRAMRYEATRNGGGKGKNKKESAPLPDDLSKLFTDDKEGNSNGPTSAA